MYTTARTKQGGSVAIFLVVSVVLAALVIGGMYAVQKRGVNVRTNEPIVQQNPTSEESQPKTDTNEQAAEDKAKEEAAQKEADQKKNEAEKQAQAQAQKKAEADKAAQQKAEEDKKKQEAAAQQPTIPQTSTAPSASTLPTTGPEDSFLQIVAGAILAAILIAYLKSYRHRFGSLRQ